MTQRKPFVPDPEVKRLYVEEGMTLGAVAQELGMSAATARKHLLALGVELRPRALQLPMEDILREYEGGASTVALGRKYGVDQATIFNRLKALKSTRSVAEAMRLHAERPVLAPGSLEELAAELGVAPERLRELLVRHGFLVEPTGRVARGEVTLRGAQHQALRKALYALEGLWGPGQAVTALAAAGHAVDEKRARRILRDFAAAGVLVKVQDRPVLYRVAER